MTQPQIDRLLETIEQAFADTPYPGDHRINRWGDHLYRFRGDWRAIPFETTDSCSHEIGAFEPEGLRYYLPALLKACILQGYHGDILDGLFWALAPALQIEERYGPVESWPEYVQGPYRQIRIERMNSEDVTGIDRQRQRLADFSAILTTQQKRAILQFFESFDLLPSSFGISDEDQIDVDNGIRFWKQALQDNAPSHAPALTDAPASAEDAYSRTPAGEPPRAPRTYPPPGMDFLVRTKGGNVSWLKEWKGETAERVLAEALTHLDNPDLLWRATAYTVLGFHDADPRPYIGVAADGLPDVDWITIPEGPFIYGDDDKTAYEVWTLPADRQVGQLPAYCISRYPITHKQYQAFIDAEDGFRDDRWWNLPPRYDRYIRSAPHEPFFAVGNQPRTSVTWFEAVAFCRWWSWRLGGGCDTEAMDSWAVRLPSEAEWEKAARGEAGQTYAFGDAFSTSRGNTIETGIGGISPVGMFSAWPSPYGVEDMSGNVWEWCLDIPEPVSIVTKYEVLWRVLRGGSCLSYRETARAAYRYRMGAWPSYGIEGFRVVSPRVTP